MLVEALAQERKQIYQTGVVEGKEEALLRFINWRFQPTAAEGAQIAEQLGKITNPQQLSFLIDQCLQAETLADFTAVLAKILPNNRMLDKQS